MEEAKENPPIPSNYVSILHLRERWLEEKERKLKEDEEQRRQEQELQEHKVLQRKREEERDRKSEGKVVDQKRGTHSKSGSQNGSQQIQRENRTAPVSIPCAENERRTNSNEIHGEALTTDPRMKKKKKKSMRKRGEEKNPRAGNGEIGSTSGVPENLREEIQETKCEHGLHKGKKNVRARRIDGKRGNGIQGGHEAGNMGMKEMEDELSHLSVSFEIRRRDNRLMRTFRGTTQGRRNFMDHQNLHRRRPHEPRGVGMVWVRKDELSNNRTDGSLVELNCKDSTNLDNTSRLEKSG